MAYLLVIKFVADMGEIGLFRLKLTDDIQGLIQAKMRGMGLESQGIEDQNIQTFQQGPTRAGDSAHIRAVGHISNAKTENVEVRVFERDGKNLLADHPKWRCINPLETKFRDEAITELIRLRTKRIGKGRANFALHFTRAKQGHRVTQMPGDGPKVIQTEQVIRVIMSEEHSMDDVNFFP